MRIFAGEWVKNVLTRLGMQEGEAIESRMVSRRVEGAQKKVEERNFEIRKNLLEYDEVMDEQRKRVYGYRQRILDGANCKQLIMEMIDEQIDRHLDEFLAKDYGTSHVRPMGRRNVGRRTRSQEFPRARFRDRAQRVAKDEAERNGRRPGDRHASTKTCPRRKSQSEWNWEALAKLVNTRWKLNLRDRDLKQLGARADLRSC